MDYKKEYKDALGRARNLHKDAIDMGDSLRAKMAEIIFPELKESEDEEIRTWLEEHIEAMPDNSVEFKDVKRIDILHWLEKQETSYTGKDVDDAYLKGISDTKNEIERQYEANYQIRKDIATFIFNYRGDLKDRAKWMNYLGIKVSFIEKQGEKPQGKTDIEAIEEEKVDNANKVEPRFKVRDWVVKKDGENFSNGRKTAQITDIAGEQYWFDCGTWLEAKDIRLWTIQDTEDGDVLATESSVFIFQEEYIAEKPIAYCGIMNGCFVKGHDCWTNEPYYPATEEQHNLLFEKIEESGYEWDADNKQLIKL